jgi:hypothetical protein
MDMDTLGCFFLLSIQVCHEETKDTDNGDGSDVFQYQSSRSTDFRLLLPVPLPPEGLEVFEKR